MVAWLYGFWSSKKTIILLTTVTAAALFGFAIAGDAVVSNRTLLYVLLVIPIWGINTVTAVLAVYSSEIYPTRIRSRGTGLAAGASKAGGVMIIALVVLGVAAPSIATTTLVGRNSDGACRDRDDCLRCRDPQPQPGRDHRPGIQEGSRRAGTELARAFCGVID